MGYFSNGSEGDDYMNKWCLRCVHLDPETGYPDCFIWDGHIVHNYDKKETRPPWLDVFIPGAKTSPPGQRQVRHVQGGKVMSDFTVERLRTSIMARFNAEDLKSTKVDVEQIAEIITVAVRGFQYGQKALKTFRYPRDWWQAFRERWFPRWWLRRWPVAYTVVDVDAIYPDLEKHMPREWQAGQRFLMIRNHDDVEF